MRWDDFDWNPTRTKLRQFGMLLVFFGALFAIAAVAKGKVILAWYIGPLAMAIGGLIGILSPEYLRWPFVVWTLAAFPVGWVVSQLILLGIFIFVFLPIGLVFRLLRRDALNLKVSNRPSFWNPAPANIDSNRYFRQY